MSINVEPLFLDYKAWRLKNEDLANEVRGGIDAKSVWPCECVGLSRYGDAFDDCEECDGSGKVGGDVTNEVERQMRLAYEKQLERDYRLAVQAISGSPRTISSEGASS